VLAVDYGQEHTEEGSHKHGPADMVGQRIKALAQQLGNSLPGIG
jgi:hypothetical protein